MDPAALKAQLAGMMGGGKMAPAHEGKGDEEEPPPPPAYVIHSAGSAADVTDFIAKKGNIHEVNEEGQTPLFSAALRKSDVMEALVRAGADIEKPDNTGVRPIQAAAWAGRGANCKCLVLAKARIDENTFKPPSVGQALVYEVVDALISSGVSCQWVLAGVPTFHGILTKDLPGVAGVGVQDALPGQSAKRCGLQPGDVITAVNEQPIQNELALTNLLKASLLADRWALTVQRPGEGTIEKDLVLGAVGYSWYNVDGVGLLREKERALAIKAEEEKEEFARQQKRATFEPVVGGVRAIVEKNVKKGHVQPKDVASALKKKCPKGLGKTDLKTISENWEEEEGDTPTDLTEFVMFVCEQLDELGVDVPGLAGELAA